LRAGAEWVEVAHVFLERPDEPVSARYEASDMPALERQVAAIVGELVDGRYEPSATPGIELCAGCPGRTGLCRWSPEQTSAPRASAP
jgi:ATP-dependent helicase/nuclease subunit A